MKVYYVGNSFDGCYYTRCLVPLIANGWDGSYTSMLSLKKSSQEELKRAMASDVIVFHRSMDRSRSKVFEIFADAKKQYNFYKALGVDNPKLASYANKLLVFDNDDTMKAIDRTRIAGLKYTKAVKVGAEMLRNADESIKKADLVTASTEFLANEYRELNDNVVVLPNSIDEDDWGKPLRNTGDKIRVGLVGSVVSDDYLLIKNVINTLSKDKRFQVVVYGLPPQDGNYKKQSSAYKKEIEYFSSLNIEWQPITPLVDYFDTLNSLRLDAMLIPREDNYFNRAKSNIKYLEASMCEVPVITSGWKGNPYEKDKVLFANTDNEWYYQLEKLAREGTARADEAKAHVLKNYNIKNNSQLWLKAYEKALHKKRRDNSTS